MGVELITMDLLIDSVTSVIQSELLQSISFLLCPCVFLLIFVRWIPFTYLWLLFTIFANLSGYHQYIGLSVAVSITLNVGWYCSQVCYKDVWPCILNAYLEDMPFAKSILPVIVRSCDLILHFIPCTTNIYCNLHHLEWYHGIFSFIIPRIYMIAMEGHMFGACFTNISNVYDARPFFDRSHLLRCLNLEYLVAFIIILGVLPFELSLPLQIFFCLKIIMDMSTGNGDSWVCNLLHSYHMRSVRNLQQKIIHSFVTNVFVKFPEFLLADALRFPTAAKAFIAFVEAWKADSEFYYCQYTDSEPQAAEKIKLILNSSVDSLSVRAYERRRESLHARLTQLQLVRPSAPLFVRPCLKPKLSSDHYPVSTLMHVFYLFSALIALLRAQSAVILASHPATCKESAQIAASLAPSPVAPIPYRPEFPSNSFVEFIKSLPIETTRRRAHNSQRNTKSGHNPMNCQSLHHESAKIISESTLSPCILVDNTPSVTLNQKIVDTISSCLTREPTPSFISSGASRSSITGSTCSGQVQSGDKQISTRNLFASPQELTVSSSLDTAGPAQRFSTRRMLGKTAEINKSFTKQ